MAFTYLPLIFSYGCVSQTGSQNDWKDWLQGAGLSLLPHVAGFQGLWPLWAGSLIHSAHLLLGWASRLVLSPIGVWTEGQGLLFPPPSFGHSWYSGEHNSGRVGKRGQSLQCQHLNWNRKLPAFGTGQTLDTPGVGPLPPTGQWIPRASRQAASSFFWESNTKLSDFCPRHGPLLDPMPVVAI